MKNSILAFKLALIPIIFPQAYSFAQIIVKPSENPTANISNSSEIFDSTILTGFSETISDSIQTLDNTDRYFTKRKGRINSASLICSQPNPKPIYDASPGKSVNCDAGCVSLSVRDSNSSKGGIGEYMEFAALIVLKTDGFNDSQCTFEVWTGGNLLTRIGPSNTGTGTPVNYFTWSGFFGASMNSKTVRFWLNNICQSRLVEYKFFDSGNNSAVPWYVWDPATNTVLGSGTFTGAGGTTGTFTNWGGISTWTCFSSAGVPCGAAFTQTCGRGAASFCPQLVKPGKYGITYTWDNTIGCTNSFTDTIEVLPKYNTKWMPPASLCESNSSTSLTSYLNASATPGGTWSGTGVSGNTWNTVGLNGPINITYTYAAGTSCESSETHSIIVNPKPTVTASTTTPGFCANGVINAVLTAGGANTYVWAGGVGSTSSVTVYPNSTTTYTVTGSTAAGCMDTASVSISVNPAPTAIATQTDVKCKGNSTGMITSNVLSGTAPFIYNWSINATTQNITGLSAGTYSLTVTDSKGCTSISTVTIAEPTTVVNLPSPTSTGTGCDANIGTATASATGGTGLLTYLWNPGNKSGAAITGIAAGSYTVTVTDANGCTATGSTSVSPPAGGPVITINNQKNLNCNGDLNGNAYTSATGGSGNYTYTWSSGQTGSGSSSSIINVAAGIYTITYTDISSSCSNIATVNITEPLPYNMAPAITNILCYGEKTGSIDITPTGNNPGTIPAYTFDWSPVNMQTEDISGLNPGTYVLSVTDSKGCTASFSYTITEPLAAVSVTTSSTPAICGSSTGASVASAIGGTGTLTYLWSNSSTTIVINNLPSGNYTVTVTDANGCSNTSIASVGDANGPTATAGKTDASCGQNDGTATAIATGGTGALSYLWSNLSTNTTINNLAAGTYSVTISDANNCKVITSVTITGSPNPIAGITASTYIGESPFKVDFTNTSTGGTTYTWYFGDGSLTYTGLTSNYTYKSAGKYYACIVAETAGGCKDSACKTIEVTEFLITIPNVITPNGDNKNDGFKVLTKGILKLDVSIWNRWGLKLWEGTELRADENGYVHTWDGNTSSGGDCPDGTYYYLIKAYKFDNAILDYAGFVTLIR